MRELFSYSFVLPPTIFIVISLFGALVGLARPRFGIGIALISSLLLYLLATPAVSMLLSRQLTSSVPTDPDLGSAQAIVVPAADIRPGNGEGPDRIGLLTLDRLANAARLYRRMHLPIVVSGGRAKDAEVPMARLMRQELEQNFGVPVAFEENGSKTTYENALNTSKILQDHNITFVIISVQKRDVPRVAWSFNKFGVHAVFDAPGCMRSITYRDLFPSMQAGLDSFYVLHEIIGLLYYRIVYRN